MFFKSGYMFKLGDGPINYDWNRRFFVLDSSAQELTYYLSESETTARGSIMLAEALISNITLIKERQHSFSVQTAPQPQGKTYFFSCNTFEESLDWQECLIAASERHKQNLAMVSFQKKQAPPKGTKNPQLYQSEIINDRQQRDSGFDESLLLNDESHFFNIEEIRARHTIGGGAALRSTIGGGPISGNASTIKGDGKIHNQSKGAPSKSIRLQEKHIASQSSGALDSEDERVQFINDHVFSRQLGELPYQKRKISTVKEGELTRDMGNVVPQDIINHLNRAQATVMEEIGVKPPNPNNKWKTVEYSNGVQIQALNPFKSSIRFDMKAFKALIKLIVIIEVVLFIVDRYMQFALSPFMTGMIISFIIFKKLKNILVFREKYPLAVMAKMLVKGDSHEIGSLIFNLSTSNNQCFDPTVMERTEISKIPQNNAVITEEILDLPREFLIRSFIARRKALIQTYWCKETNADGSHGAFYVLRKTASSSAKPPKKQKEIQISSFEEAFVIIPMRQSGIKGKPLTLEEVHCMVMYITDLNYLGEKEKLPFAQWLSGDSIKINRANLIMASLQERITLYEETQHAARLQKQEKETNPFSMAADAEDNDSTGTDGEDDNANNQKQSRIRQVEQRLTMRRFELSQGQACQRKENPRNIYIKAGQRLGISHRFPGYFRLENGLLWCHNLEELNAQVGVFAELIKRAGKQVMEGKGIVSVSLPVRIFEKRSMVERICDLWCSGQHYLKRASQEVADPVERMKQIITFVVSGMHQVATQRKPFNPIIGETFHGVWPNGNKLFVEHISHQPPISCFLVEDTVDQRYTLSGSFEYQARVTDSGNSVIGRLAGKNKITFAMDGSSIEYEYPSLKISGLIYGKRTTQWLGPFEFIDTKHGLRGRLEFASESGFFASFIRKQSLPVDCFEGVIVKNGIKISDIQGSWLEFLKIDNKLYWELEACDTILPVSAEHYNLLPSDCRYRQDSIAFAANDLPRAQKEKERLEEIQRQDRTLRERAATKRGVIRIQ